MANGTEVKFLNSLLGAQLWQGVLCDVLSYHVAHNRTINRKGKVNKEAKLLKNN